MKQLFLNNIQLSESQINMLKHDECYNCKDHLYVFPSDCQKHYFCINCYNYCPICNLSNRFISKALFSKVINNGN